MKVRCLPDKAASSVRCQRCAKAKRECLFATRSVKKKPRARTDTRIARLEEELKDVRSILTPAVDPRKSDRDGYDPALSMILDDCQVESCSSKSSSLSRAAISFLTLFN